MRIELRTDDGRLVKRATTVGNTPPDIVYFGTNNPYILKEIEIDADGDVAVYRQCRSSSMLSTDGLEEWTPSPASEQEEALMLAYLRHLAS
jgi:hypothetical protein